MSRLFFKRLIQAAPLLMIALAAVFYFAKLRYMTLDEILSYTPTKPLLAIPVILAMYALKSLSFFFPMMLIFAATGVLLPLYVSIPLDIAGIVVMASLPYLIGRYAESELVDSLAGKHKKVEQVREFGTEHQFFGAFFLRIISCLPYDLVSLVMGSMRFGYGKYILGTVLGTAPGAVLTTIMGSAVTEPLSSEFIICGGLNVIISVVSAVTYNVYLKRKNHAAI